VQLAIYWRLLASIRGWFEVGHDVAALDRQFDVTSYIALFSTANGRMHANRIFGDRELSGLEQGGKQWR